MQQNSHHILFFEEVVDVKQIGPPRLLAVVTVGNGHPERTGPCVLGQSRIHKDDQHVGGRQPGKQKRAIQLNMQGEAPH
jgi:hypothetical protein